MISWHSVCDLVYVLIEAQSRAPNRCSRYRKNKQTLFITLRSICIRSLLTVEPYAARRNRWKLIKCVIVTRPARPLSHVSCTMCEQRATLSDIDNVNQCKPLSDDECGGGIACGPKPACVLCMCVPISMKRYYEHNRKREISRNRHYWIGNRWVWAISISLLSGLILWTNYASCMWPLIILHHVLNIGGKATCLENKEFMINIPLLLFIVYRSTSTNLLDFDPELTNSWKDVSRYGQEVSGNVSWKVHKCPSG